MKESVRCGHYISHYLLPLTLTSQTCGNFANSSILVDLYVEKAKYLKFLGLGNSKKPGTPLLDVLCTQEINPNAPSRVDKRLF